VAVAMAHLNSGSATPAVGRIVALLIAVSVGAAACASDGPDADTLDGPGSTPSVESPEGTPDTGGTTGSIDSTGAGASEDTTNSSDPTDAAAPAVPAARCIPEAPEAPEAADASQGARTLQVWHGLDGDVVAFFDEMIAEFEAEHPGIDVEAAPFEGSYSDGLAELAGLDESERPDVFMGSNASIRLQYDSGLFVPPSECTGGTTADALTDLLPIIEATHTVDGTLVAAPYNVSTPVMMYDRALWREAGLDPDDPPATFDELETVVRQLRDSGAATTGMVLYDRAASWLVEQTAAQEGRLLVEPANGRAGTAVTDVAFDTPESVATLERFRSLKRDGYILWAGINQSGRDDLLQLANAEAPSGLTLHTSASTGDAIRIVESGLIGAGIEVGAAPFPGNAPGGLVGGGSWWLLDHDDPGRVGAAWTLVDWLIQPERVAELAAFTGYVPTTERAAASPVTTAMWAEEPSMRVGFDQLSTVSVTDAAAGMQVGPMIEVQRALEVAAAQAIDGDQDPAEQLRAAEAAARAALDAYDAVYGTSD
jgi:sn-glycerol 3-phosphate transport system substrate-binding protein